MIRADIRSGLGAADLELVVTALSQGSASRRAELEQMLSTDGPDALLDAPELLERLAALRGMLVPSAPLFLYVAMRHFLRAATVDDRDVADYLASMVLAFGQRDRANRVSWNDDQHHAYLVDILADLDGADGDRKFRITVHLGNYALWLSGLFPDYIAARRLRHGGPDVSYYDALGRRGFGLASGHQLADRYGLDNVFRAAAERFVAIRAALNGVSDRFLFPGACTPDRIMRQMGVH